MSKTEWNDGYIIEGCDRTHIISCMIEDFLISHPAVIKSGSKDKVEQALKLINETYQTIGALDEGGE